MLAGGILWWAEKQKFETIHLIQLPEAGKPGETTKDKTTDLSSKALVMEDWQTYRNKECGFEMKYPAGWDYYLVENEHTRLPKKGDIIFASREVINNFKENPHSFYGKSLTFTLRSHIKSTYEDYVRPIYIADDEYGDVFTEDIIIDGIKGDGYVTEALVDILGFSKGDITVTYVIPHGYRYLEFHLSDYQQIDVFKKIIDSIELTEAESPFTFEEREKIREHDMATIGYLILLVDCEPGPANCCEDVEAVVDACQTAVDDWTLDADKVNCFLDDDFSPIDPQTYNPYYIAYEYGGESRGLMIWADAEESAWYCDWDDVNFECNGPNPLTF